MRTPSHGHAILEYSASALDHRCPSSWRLNRRGSPGEDMLLVNTVDPAERTFAKSAFNRGDTVTLLFGAPTGDTIIPTYKT